MIKYETLEMLEENQGAATSDFSQGYLEAISELKDIAESERTELTFGQALEILKAKPGRRIRRRGWFGYVTLDNGVLNWMGQPWQNNSRELLAEDWEVVGS